MPEPMIRFLLTDFLVSMMALGIVLGTAWHLLSLLWKFLRQL